MNLLLKSLVLAVPVTQAVMLSIPSTVASVTIPLLVVQPQQATVETAVMVAMIMA